MLSGVGARAEAGFMKSAMQLGHQRGLAAAVPEGGLSSEYDLVCRAIARFGALPSPPPTSDLTAHLGLSPAALERALLAWCGLTTAAFAEALAAADIRSRLAATQSWPHVRGRIHAFNVRIAAMITDEARRRGVGLQIGYGFHESPFGEALLLLSDEGLCGLAFVDEAGGHNRRAALDDMAARWPRARFREAPESSADLAARIFAGWGSQSGDAVPLVLIGTPFDLQVWQALLRIPAGRLVSYTQIARHLGRPSASRAVGTANGRNPISFVVPCHRALRGDGSLGGYYWGLTRKRAVIVWEAGSAEARAAAAKSVSDTQAVG
jgi:AraC family transcriptional regulator of adaptative response/methylated-DNA-[protein]-cysteine methyltransferase